MIITAILNAGRNSFSFFLLLIVCMGYGVVKDSLGTTMIYVRILALAHFVFGVIYGVASLAVTPRKRRSDCVAGNSTSGSNTDRILRMDIEFAKRYQE